MYSLRPSQSGIHKTLVIGIASIYLTITWAIPLLHNDDCPATCATESERSPVPSDQPCPACKFLAGANAITVPCDAGPVLAPSDIAFEFVCDSCVMVGFPCAGSITLRGPPIISLS